jgi:hypothetical protein
MLASIEPRARVRHDVYGTGVVIEAAYGKFAVKFDVSREGRDTVIVDEKDLVLNDSLPSDKASTPQSETKNTIASLYSPEEIAKHRFAIEFDPEFDKLTAVAVDDFVPTIVSDPVDSGSHNIPALEAVKIAEPSSALIASQIFESDIADGSEASQIPAFDPSVMTGIYAEFAELICRGTTLAPQFPFNIAKMIVGLKMSAAGTRFATLDVEPRYQIAAIGDTGSGKGESFRRSMQVIEPEGAIVNLCGFKFTDSIDSGAGLKDFFFTEPEHQPVLVYVDEIATLGHKSSSTRNPDIMDTIFELADKTFISRIKANVTRTKRDARLSTFMCGQNGLVYTSALAGRAELGATDRLYPEFSVPQESGNLPRIEPMDAIRMLDAINALNYGGTINMSPEAQTQLDVFWNSQETTIRKKNRYKKFLILDAYMNAFGRGSWIVEPEDAAIAIKICTRQLSIRKVCFRAEIPDRIGYYTQRLKDVTQIMQAGLVNGTKPEKVAKSRRDFETLSHAFRDNELHIFKRAWESYEPTYLQLVEFKMANGHSYKYLPKQIL